MGVRRVVPNIQASNPEDSRPFYEGFLGLTQAMDMGWIRTFVSPQNPTAQVSVLSSDKTAPFHPGLSIEVDNIDEVHAEALRRGIKIAYPLTTEEWGVRCFFAVDPNGKVVNIMAHEAPAR